jgi:hypothetical protein
MAHDSYCSTRSKAAVSTMMDIDIKYSKQSVIMAEQTRKIVLSNQPKFQKSWLHVSIICFLDCLWE